MLIVLNKNINRLDSWQIWRKKHYRLSTETFQWRYMNNIIISIVNIVCISDIIARMINIFWHPSSQPRWEAHQSWFLYFESAPICLNFVIHCQCYLSAEFGNGDTWTRTQRPGGQRDTDKLSEGQTHRIDTNAHVYKRKYTYFLEWCDFLLVINQINKDIEIEWMDPCNISPGMDNHAWDGGLL